MAALAVAGMVLLLASNRKKAQEQTEAVSNAGRGEAVTTWTVTREDCILDFSSNAVAQPQRELNFVSEISGRVVAVYADKGTRVSKGTPLLKIDSELLEADYKSALASYEALKKDEERFTRSYEAGGVTSQQLDNIRTQLIAAESRLAVSRWKLENAVVKAPIAGTVNNRFVETGALIAPNVPLFEIVDEDRVKLTCSVPESKATLISAGQKVSAVRTGASGKTFKGRVSNVGLKTDRGMNYPVEVIMDSDKDLHAGMYLKVSFDAASRRSCILVPRKAVVGSVLSADVYVVENEVARRREVKLGEMYGEMIEILDGLDEGEQVILSGLMNVSDGSRVNVVGVNEKR